MANRALLLDVDVDRADNARSEPQLKLVHDASNYSDLERCAPGVGQSGVHPRVLGILVTGYAMMLVSFWISFARDLETAALLTVVTVLMIIYFSLVAGGITLADTPAPGERQRSFSEFLHGPVQTLTGVIDGREAAVQILLLPACLTTLAIAIGVIAQITNGG